MAFVLKHKSRGYVKEPGFFHTYTRSMDRAHRFETREAADLEKLETEWAEPVKDCTITADIQS